MINDGIRLHQGAPRALTHGYVERGIFWRGGKLWIRYTDAAGKQRRESTEQTTIVGARDKLREAENKSAGGHVTPSASGRSRLTFGDFVADHYRPVFLDPGVTPARLTPSTRRSTDWHLNYHLLSYFGIKRLTRITHQEIRTFIRDKSGQQRHSYSRKNPNPNPDLCP